MRPRTPKSSQGVPATDAEEQPSFKYEGQPLIGVWAKAGVSGASVIKSAVESQRAVPRRTFSPISTGHCSSNSSLSSGSSRGTHTPDLRRSPGPTHHERSRKQLKHSVSGPVKGNQASSVYRGQMPRRSQSEQFPVEAFQEVRTDSNFIHHRLKTQQVPAERGVGQQRHKSTLKTEERREREDRQNQREVSDRRQSLEGVDYDRSCSDTTTLRPIEEGGQRSKRPESEPASRGRRKTRNQKHQHGRSPRH